MPSYLHSAQQVATLAAATLRRVFSAAESDQDSEFSPVSYTICSFLDRIMHVPPASDDFRHQKLVCALEEHMYLWGVLPASNGAFIHQTCKHSAAMAELSYHHHDFDTQLQIAKFTWFMIYIDDLASNMPSVLEDFQMKLLRRETPDHPVLQHFASHLLDMYKFWDSLAANGITSAALEFITGCALEIHTEIRKIKLDSSSASWPYFLRAQTGVAPAYAFMIFRTISGSMSQYMQVIADVCLFIDLTNDVLSFYKEELAGETANYIHNRAGVTGRAPTYVLAEVAEEALAAHDRVTMALRGCGSQGLDAWMTFVHGYLAFHLTQDRYKLKDLLC